MPQPPLSFDYGTQPPRAVSGMVHDYNLATVDTAVLNDATGTWSGKIARLIPAGFGNSNPRKVQRVPTPAATRPVFGVVARNPGLPGDPAVTEYVTGDNVPVVRKGRVWVYCENFAVDPATAADTWYTRATGVADAIGNLRYGNDDGGSCDAIPLFRVKPLDAIPQPGGAALVLLDTDFTRP